MDYIQIMEEFLKLDESIEERVTNTRDYAISISIQANNLLKLFQFKSNEEIMNLINDKCEIKENLVAFILPILYLCHNLSIKGDDIEAMIYSEILKEYNKN